MVTLVLLMWCKGTPLDVITTPTILHTTIINNVNGGDRVERPAVSIYVVSSNIYAIFLGGGVEDGEE